MGRTRLLALVVLVAAGLGGWLLLRREPTLPPAPVAEPAWDVAPPPNAPTGDPVRLGSAARPDPIRHAGTFSYEQVPTGRFGPERTKVRRAVRGTFTAVETTTGPASARQTALDATFELTDAVQSAAPAPRRARVRLSFTTDAAGVVTGRSIRLDAPADLTTELEVFQLAFTARFGLPPTGARVGERLPIDDAFDAGPTFHRPALFLFQNRARVEGAVTVPVEGGVWVAGREGSGADGRVLLAASLRHVRTAENGAPGEPHLVTIDYRARLDATRAIALADGRVVRQTADLSRRIAYRADDLDYAILVRAALTVAEEPGR